MSLVLGLNMSSLNNNNANNNANNDESIVKYYYVWRKNNCAWCYSKTAFVIHDSDETRINGSFLSSNWYKTHIPTEFEIAILKVCVDKIGDNTLTPTRKESVKNKIETYLHEMGKSEDVSKLNFVILTHKMRFSDLEQIKTDLKQKFADENEDRVTINKVMQTTTGMFSLSFAQIKNEEPCMYCPRFSIPLS